MLMKTLILAATAAMAMASQGFASDAGLRGEVRQLLNALRATQQSAAPQLVTRNAIVSRTGTIRTIVNIEVRSAIPATQVIQCIVSYKPTWNFAVGSQYQENVTVTAIRSGNRATCTAVTPYLWPTLEVNAGTRLEGPQVYVSTEPATATGISRFVTIDQPSAPLPANGATTTFTVNTAL
jgi:hypothetical protein